MESGSTLCFWALSKTGPKAATLTGNILGTANSSSEVLISELKKVPAKKLLRAASLAMISVSCWNNYIIVGKIGFVILLDYGG